MAKPLHLHLFPLSTPAYHRLPHTMPPALAPALDKEAALRSTLAALGEAMVAFSAGVDSSYLLAVAQEALGDRVPAVTADSPSLTRASLAEAEAFCRARGIRHRVVKTDEFEQAEYRAN